MSARPAGHVDGRQPRAPVSRDPAHHLAPLHQWRHAELLERLPQENAARLLADALAAERRYADRGVRALDPWPSNPPEVYERHVRGPNLVRIRRVLDYLLPGDRVFDIGTNYGYLTGVLLRDAGLSVYTGIDLGDHQLDSVREMMVVNGLGKGIDVELVRSDLYDLTREQVAASEPTIVLVLEVLEHVPDAARALQVIASVVPESASVLLSVPLLGRLEGCWGHRSLFGHGRILRLCADAGLWVHRAEALHNTWLLVLASPRTQIGARTAAADAAPWPGLTSRRLPSYELRVLHLGRPEISGSSRWNRGSTAGFVRRERATVACDIGAGPEDAKRYGGVVLALDGGLELLRIELAATPGDAIEALFVDVTDGEGRRVARWSWEPGRGDTVSLSDRPFTAVLRPGRDGGPFTARRACETGGAVAIDVFAKAKAGREATLLVRRASYLPVRASAD